MSQDQAPVPDPDYKPPKAPKAKKPKKPKPPILVIVDDPSQPKEIFRKEPLPEVPRREQVKVEQTPLGNWATICQPGKCRKCGCEDNLVTETTDSDGYFSHEKTMYAGKKRIYFAMCRCKKCLSVRRERIVKELV